MKQTIIIKNNKVIEYGFLKDNTLYLLPDFSINSKTEVKQEPIENYSDYEKMDHLNFIVLYKGTSELDARNLTNKFITVKDLDFRFITSEFSEEQKRIIDAFNSVSSIKLNSDNTIFNNERIITVNIIKLIKENEPEQSENFIKDTISTKALQDYEEAYYLLSLDIHDYLLKKQVKNQRVRKWLGLILQKKL